MDEDLAGGPTPEPTTGLNLEKGISLVSIVVALLILGLIYVGYDSLRQSGPRLAHATTAGLEASAATACRLNCLELERTVLTWSVSNPGQKATLEGLRKAGLHVPDCPEGGQLKLEGRRVSCSLHAPRP